MANQEKLKSLIDKINWLYKSFEDNNFSNVSSLEKALIKEKILMFYDEIENIETKIQKERFPSVSSEKVVPSVEVKSVETVNAVVETVVTPEPVVERLVEAPVVEDVLETPVVEEVKAPVEEVPVVEEVVEPIVEEVVETASVVENIVPPVVEPVIEEAKEEAVDVQAEADLKKAKFEKTVEFQRQIAMPKRDMREIIDLNKSFIFKAELFNQNNDIYNQFINEINSTRTEDEAFSKIVSWTEKMNWNTEENKAYDLLLRAIEKRFLPLI